MRLQGQLIQSSGLVEVLGNVNFIIGFEPSPGLEVILLSQIQESIKDTLNNILDEQLDGSLVPESENQRGLQRLAEVRTGSDAK